MTALRLALTAPASAPAFDIVVMAASLGGREVLESVLARLPADFATPIVLVQHAGQHAPRLLPLLLARRTSLEVRYAVHGEALARGVVHVAPPGTHAVVSRARALRLSDGPRVSYARPSADRLFGSAALAFGARTLGVVLTGKLFDGAAGASAIRRAGGVVLAQDPGSCLAPDMPQAAIDRGAVHLTLPPEGLGFAIAALVSSPCLSAVLGLGAPPRAVA